MGDTLTLAQARALWWSRQALTAGPKPGLATLLGSSGWLRTLGGGDVYIAARARMPGMKRAELEAVVQSGELRVVPAARGCIYLVPPYIVGDLMALNAEAWRKETDKDLLKVGSTMKVVEQTAKAVLAALDGPMTTDALRKAMPEDSIPSFGDLGKKAGVSSPLPLALRMLELDGRVERTLDGGRLDSERYLWRKAEWVVPPAAATTAAQLVNVVGAFLDFAGPCTLSHIGAWSGRAQRDLKPVIDQLGAKPVSVEGVGESWARPGDVGAAMRAPEPRGLALLAFEDNYLINHGGLAAVADPRHHEINIDIWGDGKPKPIGEATHVLSRTIVLDGLVVGFWEVDPRAKGAVWYTFDPAPKLLASKLDELTAETAQFLLDEVGHARSFSLDSMEDVQRRADRLAALRDGKPLPALPAAAVKVARPVKPVKAEPAGDRSPAGTAPAKAPVAAKAVTRAKPVAAKKPAKKPAAPKKKKPAAPPKKKQPAKKPAPKKAPAKKTKTKTKTKKK